MSSLCKCVFPELCPNCRHLISTQVNKIREALKKDSEIYIHFKAFNKAEVKGIKKSLRRDELKRITFSYFSWPESIS